ncbi:MAG: fatty-acid--CoA ligase, partial [Candidatus Poribacteria bacterium]|nr:fatty-acid--CoA ligase [Candidatus Poribacteria bacterium]
LTPVGAVSNRTDADISDTLKQHLSVEFPKFWIPDRFVFVDEIPKTSVGKSDKQTLRKGLLSAETKEKLP